MTTIFRRRSAAARTRISAVAGAAVVALAVAACGGTSGGGTSGGGGAYGAAPASTASTAAAAPSSSAGAGATVSLATTKLGKVLVNSQGQTLYLFQADKGTMSVCDTACASVWPPLTTTAKPVAGPGVSASKLGTTKRSDGTTEVTYNGHPLYTFAGDSGPGQTTGQGNKGFGAEWDVLTAAGNKVDTTA